MLFASNQSFNCCFFDVDRGVQFENDNSRFRELTKRAFNQYIFRVLFRPPNYFLFFHLFNFKFDGKNIFKIFFSTNDDNSLSVELSRSIRSPQFAFSSLVSPFSDEWWSDLRQNFVFVKFTFRPASLSWRRRRLGQSQITETQIMKRRWICPWFEERRLWTLDYFEFKTKRWFGDVPKCWNWLILWHEFWLLNPQTLFWSKRSEWVLWICTGQICLVKIGHFIKRNWENHEIRSQCLFTREVAWHFESLAAKK